MKPIILFLVLLFIFLIISLGINYSSVFKTTLKTAQTYVPTPISSNKYNSPTNYYSDVNASQGVFSKTVPLTTYIVEPMENRIKKPVKDNSSPVGYNGPQGAEFTPTPQLDNSSALETVSSSAVEPVSSSVVEPVSSSVPQPDSSSVPRTFSSFPPQAVKSFAPQAAVKSFLPQDVKSFVPHAVKSFVPQDVKSFVPQDVKSFVPQDVKSFVPQAVSSFAPSNWSVKNGVEYIGNDLGTFQKTLDECKSQCLSTTGCVGFVTGQEGENQCVLKSGFQTETPNIGKNTYMLSNVTEEIVTPLSSWKSNINVEKYKDKINAALSVPNLPEPSSSGCAGTQYGCCQDNITAKMADGTNCAPYPPPTIGGCGGSQYGCCPDNVTAKTAADGTNCPSTALPSGWMYNGPNVTIGKFNDQPITAYAGTGPKHSGYVIKGPNGNVYSNSTPTCNLSQYGCCPDNETAKNADGTNCSSNNTWSINGLKFSAGKISAPNTTAYAAKGPNNAGLVIEAPNGNVFTLSTTNQLTGCADTQYGCCPDGVTSKNDANGSNCAIGGCAGTQYGCCPDGVTYKNVDGTNCSPYPPPPIGGCAGTQYGCCPDNVTAKMADGSNCAPYPPPPSITNTVFIPPPRMPLVENSYSNSTEYASADGTSDSMTNTSNYNSNTSSNSNSNNSSNNSNSNSNSNNSNSNSNSNNSSNNNSNGMFNSLNNMFNSSNNSSNSTESSCPSCPAPQPCPPCGRCPEPSFDCKKVPNYSSTNSEYLPMPVLSDFSQFGM
jgi:hypothetical protein